MRKYLLPLILASYFWLPANAQSDSLIGGAIAADSLFWIAYNTCDVPGMMRFIPEDLEFYHDKGGITLGDSAFEASIKNGLCSDQGKFRLRREEVPGSGKANPMQKNGQLYGVLMTGRHVFYLSQNGQKEHADGIAPYADLWLLRDGQWKLSRVFSYDHQPVSQGRKLTIVPVPAATLKEYAGKYDGGKMGSLTVINAKGYLTVISAGKRFDVYPASSNLFYAKDRDLSFQFAKKGAGIIDVMVRENGELVDTFSAKRR